MKRLKRPGLQFYVNKLVAGEPFAFVRYGDGEWKVITGHMDEAVLCGRTHHMNLPGLQNATAVTLTEHPRREENFYLATRCAYKGKPGAPEYYAWLQWMWAHRVDDLEFHDCNVFAEASAEGRLWPFVEAIRNLDALRVVVGPRWLKDLDRVFPVDVFIEIREVDCWHDANRIMSRCVEVEPPAFYSISAGVAANPLCHWLYHYKWYGRQSWILDVGSLWDPFCGVQSRSYHKRLTADVVKSDLGGGRR